MINGAVKYGTIYCDPPWRWESYSQKGRDRCPDGARLLDADGYPTMTLAELMSLPVDQAAAADCRLFMWVTDSHLPQALQLGAAWGFTYSTVAFYWFKTTTTGKPMFGGGKVTRKGAEQCLLFLRGALDRKSASVRQVITAPIRQHSRKPDEVYERIEKLVDGPFLELFARTARTGWDVMHSDQAGRWLAPRMIGANATPATALDGQLGLPL